MQQPELLDCFAHVHGHVGVGLLYEEGISAGFVDALDVTFLDGGAENDDDEGFKAGLASNPFEHLHTHFDGELQIEEDNARERELFTIGVWCGTRKVIDGLLAIGDDLNGISDLGLFEGVLKDIDIPSDQPNGVVVTCDCGHEFPLPEDFKWEIN